MNSELRNVRALAHSVQRNVHQVPLGLRAAFWTALLALAFAQDSFSEPTPGPDLVSQGLAAVQTGDFQAADDDFRDAVQSSGPGAYHAVGSAEAAIPGRELRAVCWLAAYLAVQPEGPDAAETRAIITRLMTRHREKTLQRIQEFADHGPPSPASRGTAISNPYLQAPQWDNGPTRAQEAHEQVLRGFAGRWVETGDYDAVRRVMDMMGKIGWYVPVSDACTYLVRAECDEAARRFAAGDTEDAARLLADAQKDASMKFAGIYSDPERPYGIAMAQLQMARELVAKGKFDDARHFIEMTSDEPDGRINDDTRGSIATTKIVLARAQLKAGDREGARATLTDAARIAFTVTKTGSPLKLETLRDVANAQIDAGDLEDARAALTAAVPLVVIYNDPDHARLNIVTDQLKAGDKDGAQKTAALMTDPALKAKALAEIDSPPKPPKPGDPPPLVPPLPSQYLARPSGQPPPRPAVDAARWMSLLELDLDAPCFTAFSDDADPIDIARAIQQEPVRQARPAPTPDLPGALELVSNRMIAAQIVVSRQLKNQFDP